MNSQYNLIYIFCRYSWCFGNKKSHNQWLGRPTEAYKSCNRVVDRVGIWLLGRKDSIDHHIKRIIDGFIMKLKSLEYNWKLIAKQSTSALIHLDISCWCPDFDAFSTTASYFQPSLTLIKILYLDGCDKMDLTSIMLNSSHLNSDETYHWTAIYLTMDVILPLIMDYCEYEMSYLLLVLW